MRLLDLFSGIGGFSLGLSKAGMVTKEFCEIEPYCAKVLSKNFKNIHIHKDIRSLHIAKDEFDVICGGFPCQDISIAGKNAGINGSKSGLWSEFSRIISEGAPKYAIIENVSALLGRGLNVVLKDLAEIGYDATWTTFDTKYFGLPQRRRRVYIIAVRDGIPANSDIFQFGERDSEQLRDKMEAVKGKFCSHFKEAQTGREISFFTRQRSNEMAICGVSSTLAKRDYKSYTDIVFDDGYMRRVTPDERMRLQGFPCGWLDSCGLSDSQKFTCNGMTIPVVEHIGKLIVRFDNA